MRLGSNNDGKKPETQENTQLTVHLQHCEPKLMYASVQGRYVLAAVELILNVQPALFRTQ